MSDKREVAREVDKLFTSKFANFDAIFTLKKSIAKDKKYMITAIPITTRRFGPSGSLKNKNIVLEHARDVIPKISNEIFFDLKYIFKVYIKFMGGGVGVRLEEF